MRSWDDLFIGLDASSGGTATTAVAEQESDGRRGWIGRLRENLSASRKAMVQQIATVAFDPNDDAVWERIEEGLIAADVGVTSTVAIVGRLEGEAAAGRLNTGDQLSGALRTIGADLMRGEDTKDRIDV